ncbi:hypothetical protein [Membranihabitans maritimus]|uniref:hypothetical protein n=1 Tax=Membranihabitans maritimus TaxID=2904244 RepID=UPI001F205DF0|nr:hypothetical protein [Membranihabitans maritimus]
MKSNRQKWLAILMTMLTLGTAWAIRGRFGHEWGAAWAGSLGVVSMVLASGRKDWIKNWPSIMAIGAIGWGMTGMISYGVVVGYGKGTEFFNVSYGLLGLFVIGGLFGFLGGGLTGMLLETSEKKKPDWAMLVTQMVAGGYLVWGGLIYQFELLMTPPRSELWAGCLGAAAALAWYMKRNGYNRSWNVAFYSMVGGGFGFAFGNFLQTMGFVSGISFNWWNVMEYSIGFFGGLGMAYGIFNQTWPEMPKLSNSANWWSGALIFLFVPALVISFAFNHEKLAEMAERLSMSNVESYIVSQWIQVAILSLLALFVIGTQFYKIIKGSANWKNVFYVLVASWLWYFLLRTISSGTFYEYRFTSDDLGIPNIIIVLLVLWKTRPWTPFVNPVSDRKLKTQLTKVWGGVIAVLLILAAIASSSHDEMHGANKRFGDQTEKTE